MTMIAKPLDNNDKAKAPLRAREIEVVKKSIIIINVVNNASEACSGLKL